MVASFFRDKFVPGENPPGIGVNNKNRLTPCVEQYAVNRLRSQAVYFKEFFPQWQHIFTEHLFYAALEVLEEKVHEMFNPFGLDVEETGWFYYTGQPPLPDIIEL